MSEMTRRSWGVAGLSLVAAAALMACGGGDDTVEVKNCVDFVDSFGAKVTCADMKNLPGAAYPAIEGGSDASSSDGDAGADGSAADGAPIVNTKLVFTDINGKTLEVTTNSLGQFRINLRGMKAPLVASVVRTNGEPWKSMLVDDIVRAPKNNKFYTINLTKLTDVVASEMARADGLQGADSLTPQAVLRQRLSYGPIVNGVRQQIWASLLANNVADPTNFDPVRTPFVANRTGADKVLEDVTVNRSSSQTVITAVSGAPTAPTTPTTPTTPVSPPTTGISSPVGTVSGTVR